MGTIESFDAMIARKRRERAQGTDEAWYAVRVIPGAQLPRREYVAEVTSLGKDGRPRGKGYRIVPNIKHDLSAIERALTEGGFYHYMPSEKRLVRDRRHTDLYKVRRFALMVGYVFVWQPHSWSKLADTYGVHSIVRTAEGEALPITWDDIHSIRAVEAEYDAFFDVQNKNARAKLRKNAKKDPRLKKLVGALDIAGTMSVPMNAEIFQGFTDAAE